MNRRLNRILIAISGSFLIIIVLSLFLSTYFHKSIEIAPISLLTIGSLQTQIDTMEVLDFEKFEELNALIDTFRVLNTRYQGTLSPEILEDYKKIELKTLLDERSRASPRIDLKLLDHYIDSLSN